MEAIIGEEGTIEDEAVEFEFVVVVIMRLLELFRFVFELFVFCCGILVAVELGMTRVGLVEAVAVVLVVTANKNVYLEFKKKKEFSLTSLLVNAPNQVVGCIIQKREYIPVEVRGLSAIIFFPPGPVITIS